jgi:predicted unusual protein kinase regulating ubiquinone biosynthesis (AarF/ABC1/UbiB family)
MNENGIVSDLPRRAVTRTAKLASLPIGFAARAALGIGKRTFGRSAELVATEVQQRTAEQMFRVLGELKGGAMKLGQALSVFEAALPAELAGPYRATLTMLQEAAPPLSITAAHQVLAEEFGDGWRERFRSFGDDPAAAASIGQVHKAVWHDGRTVAVKVQYPGVARALMSDFDQLGRVARLFSVLMPGLDVKPLIAEIRDRVGEELDYRREAESQRAFAAGYAGDPDIYVPQVVAHSERVLVTEWMGDGAPLSRIIAEGTREERDRAGILFARVLFSGPSRTGLLHADPHPGNYRLLPDGRLAVIDFGAVDRLPGGFPPATGRLLRVGTMGDSAEIERAARLEGFIRDGVEVDAERLRAFVAPIAEPLMTERFRFTRAWFRQVGAHVIDLRPNNVVRQLNLPPSYALINRVVSSGVGVLCQLEAEGEFRAEALRWVPGFADEIAAAGDGTAPGTTARTAANSPASIEANTPEMPAAGTTAGTGAGALAGPVPEPAGGSR